jgi:hypothetical protein
MRVAVKDAKQSFLRRLRKRSGQFARFHRKLLRWPRSDIAHGNKIERAGETGGYIGVADNKAACFGRIRAAAAVDEAAP